VAKRANTNDHLNADLNSIFVAIESSASGYPSEAAIKGLFADFDTTSNRLGSTVKEKNIRLAAVLKGVEGWLGILMPIRLTCSVMPMSF
jgi:type I restriction enzyme M protein